VLERIADHPINRIGGLLPWSIAALTHAKLAALRISGNHMRFLLPICALGALAGCDAFSLDTYWSGDYELIAIDVKGQMMLAVDLHNGGSIGIAGPTVFSLGADEHYIVVKQHPAKDHFGKFDRGVINHFIVTRLPGSGPDKEKGVRGPLSKDDFDRLAASTHFPQFTKTFADLE
jgi:hypothetical protein